MVASEEERERKKVSTLHISYLHYFHFKHLLSIHHTWRFDSHVCVQQLSVENISLFVFLPAQIACKVRTADSDHTQIHSYIKCFTCFFIALLLSSWSLMYITHTHTHTQIHACMYKHKEHPPPHPHHTHISTHTNTPVFRMASRLLVSLPKAGSSFSTGSVWHCHTPGRRPRCICHLFLHWMKRHGHEVKPSHKNVAWTFKLLCGSDRHLFVRTRLYMYKSQPKGKVLSQVLSAGFNEYNNG